MKFKAVVVMVGSELTDRIVDAAKAAGATGATIIPARGTGINEAKTFFGLTLETQRDVVVFLLEEHLTRPVVESVRDAGDFRNPGTGIAFVLDIEQVVGLESQIPRFREEIRDQYY